MKVLSKQEYNQRVDSGLLKLHMYDIVVDEHDVDNTYFRIKCVANEVHLYPVEKPIVEVGHYEIKKERF